MIAEAATLIDFEDALRIVRSEAHPMPTEVVELPYLLGRVLAKPIHTRYDQPPFDNSAVDGFAICPADIQAGTDHRSFLIRGEMPAGSAEEFRLEPGETVRVFTGGALPANTGGIVMKEFAEVEGSSARFTVAGAMGDHIRFGGSEARAGEAFVQPGLITPPVMAALAVAGASQADVFALPKVGILVTGSELVSPGESLARGQTYECNGTALAGAIRALGFHDPTVLRVDDTVESTTSALKRLMQNCDVLITSGGISVGEYDLVRRCLGNLGAREYFWQVAMKPGKPVYFGRAGDCAIFGLPGNPVSALVTFSLLVRPYLRAICGLPDERSSLCLPTTESLQKKAGRTEFVPCLWDQEGAEPILGRASHKTSCLAEANGLLVLPKDLDSLPAGESANVIELRWGMES
ncbi:MAG: Molybdopterin molybdenumtransferase 2 [Fimbriimonadaceae bacterium]|nr:Molybdopterin molybdenumtransferase 2 [Fimbriimonadaceae bacterium]